MTYNELLKKTKNVCIPFNLLPVDRSIYYEAKAHVVVRNRISIAHKWLLNSGTHWYADIIFDTHIYT